jgi:hypothetical protein
MDWLTLREMRITGIAISTTVVTLSFAESGGPWSFHVIRLALAALGLGLVVFASGRQREVADEAEVYQRR